MWRPQANEEVELMHTTKVGSKTLALTPCLVNPATHCYRWTMISKNKRKDTSERINFVCAECRRIRNAKDGAKETSLPSWIAIRGVDREVRWEGSGNEAAHFCEGPVGRIEMQGKAAKRSLGAELATGSVEKPSTAVRKLEKKILERAKGKDQAILLQMRQAASMESTGALKKFFQRCARKRFPPLKFLRDLKDEEFEGLHFTHRGSVAKQGEEHFQERFLLYSNKKMAIFATDQQLNLLRHSETLIFDGSFEFRPQDTYQIYRGFGFIKDTHCLPVLTVLLRGKDRDLYQLQLSSSKCPL